MRNEETLEGVVSKDYCLLGRHPWSVRSQARVSLGLASLQYCVDMATLSPGSAPVEPKRLSRCSPCTLTGRRAYVDFCYVPYLLVSMANDNNLRNEAG